ncbi:MAG TPA: DUF885 domain-containing protein, partial [Planctomycetaceae bacterium]|nr:DUF885 domain-containing protein [Planctomycetaceae bacterium]
PMSKHILIFVVVTLSLTTIAMAQTVDEKLEVFFKSHLEESFQMRPFEATMLGDHRFDHLLDDVSPEARKGWLEHYQRQLARLTEEIPYDKLSRNSQIDFEILRDDLIRNIWLAENTRPFEEDPRTYGSYISDSVYTLLVRSTLPKETNIKNAIVRISQIPRIVKTAQQTLRESPPSILETAILQNRGAIGFYEKDIFELVGETAQLAELRKATLPAIAALNEHQVFLEDSRRFRANGEWRLGRALFAEKLALVLNAGLSADQVLADAEQEFIRVQQEMYVISRQLWSRYFPGKPLPPDDEAGRRATIAQVSQAVSQEHGQPEDLITDARATVGRIKEFIRAKDILRLPEPDRCQIIEMPEFRRGNSLAYLDSALPLDPKGTSSYAVSPPPSDWSEARIRSFLEEYNQHMLQVLTIHEAYPGHYVQLEYSNRCPSLIRRVLQSGVFIEGWAVYTEQMMLDQGYGDGNLALRLNQLKFYLRAVANTILDHKMHCTTMTDDEAYSFLTDGAYQSEGEARLKIIRAKQSSTQLSTYFVGRMAHYRLRQQVQRELGDQFNLGRFHQAVLDHGSVPMKYLPELVKERLAQPR